MENYKRKLSQRDIEDYVNDSEEDPNDIELDWDSDSDNSDYIPSSYISDASETEDEIEEEDEQAEDILPDIDEIENDIVFPLNAECCTAKSGRVWSLKPFPQTRRLACNIVNVTPGVTSYMSEASEIDEIFNHLITPAIKKKICLHTNEEAKRVFEKYNEKHPQRQKEWKLVTECELDAFLGVLITAGALHCRRENVKEMWSTDESIRRNIFTASMSRDRFIALSKYIRFDDKTTREARKKNDKLAAIREVWDTFVDNCRKSFTPFGEITIDEQLVTFRGKCPFRQYIKSKPGRYGIKIWAAADVETSYLYNLQVYTGKLPGGNVEKNQGARVVKDLAEPLFGSGMGKTTDNFFRSYELAEFLLTKNMTLLGTVRKNKTDTPDELKLSKHREEYSSIFCFTKNISMVSYIPKKNRMVHLLSSQHADNSVSNEAHSKPVMIMDYNRTKGAVDNSDKLIREYSCGRRTERWPFRIFMNMVDIAALDAFIIFMQKNPEWNLSNSSRRKKFLLGLGKKLAEPNMRKRLQNEAKTIPSLRRALSACGVEDEVENNCEKLIKRNGKNVVVASYVLGIEIRSQK